MKRRLLAAAVIPLVACASSSEPAASEADAVTEGSGYALPWAVGEAHAVAQGDGAIVAGGVPGDHAETLCDASGRCDRLMLHAMDFELAEGGEVRAAKAGVVARVYAGTKPGDPCFHGDGNTGRCAGKENSVVLAHDDGFESQYLHFSEVKVAVGERVAKGEVMGLAGATGQASGPHLHFQVQRPCGGTMCQSLRLSFDGVGTPAVGAHVLRSFDAGPRCWSDAVGRYVEDACVERPDAEGTWNECIDGTWRAVPKGDHCSAGTEVHGFCQTETGKWLPPRACHPFPDGRGGADWKQCATFGSWVPGVFAYPKSPLGGPLGDCSVTQ